MLRLELLEQRCMLSGFSLLADINAQPLRVEVAGGLARVGDQVFFNASDATYGTELWRSDGSKDGTALVKDHLPGVRGSESRQIIGLGNVALYVGYGGPGLGNELIRSDGTVEGTRLVKDIHPGQGDPAISGLVAVNDRAFFVARSNETDYSLWTTDGTAEGTVPLTSVEEGLRVPVGTRLAVYGDSVLFRAIRGEEQITVFMRSDGTREGTVEIGEFPFSPDGTIGADGNYYWESYEFTRPNRLWKTDGTAAGTHAIVQELPPLLGSSYEQFAAVGDAVYFVHSDGETSNVLWMTDGTEAGTRIVTTDIHEPFILGVVGSKLVVSAGSLSVRSEVWSTDGTPEGTARLLAMDPVESRTNIAGATVVNGRVYFITTGPDGAVDLWQSDGSVEGTNPIASLATLPGLYWGVWDGAVVGDRLFFMGPTENLASHLWTTDGTPEGTRPVTTDLNGTEGSNPRTFFKVGELTYFHADDGVHGRELWVTNGTPEGTRLVKDIRPGLDSSLIVPSIARTSVIDDRIYGVSGNTLLFAADDGEHGSELWRTDGTEEGTVMVRDITEGAGSSFGDRGDATSPWLQTFGGHVYFTVNLNGRYEIWRSDGTESGTEKVVEGLATWLREYQGSLYFIQSNANTPLFRTDGTGSGTHQVSPVQLADLWVVGDLMYFAGIMRDGGQEAWRSDGTAEGTFQLADAYPGATDSRPTDFTKLGEYVYFLATTPSGRTLWRTDGTVEGTNEAVKLVSQLGGGQARDLRAGDGLLYFTLDFRLWRSDGTPEGTFAVSEQGVVATTELFQAVGGEVYFAASDAEGNNRLWITDGTSQGTLPAPTAQGLAAPVSAFASGNVLLLIAQTFFGDEVFVATLTLPGDIDGDGSVQLSDFEILANHFGQQTDPRTNGDLDGDGLVQFSDFVILANNFGRSLDLAAPLARSTAIDHVFAEERPSSEARDEDSLIGELLEDVVLI